MSPKEPLSWRDAASVPITFRNVITGDRTEVQVAAGQTVQDAVRSSGFIAPGNNFSVRDRDGNVVDDDQSTEHSDEVLYVGPVGNVQGGGYSQQVSTPYSGPQLSVEQTLGVLRIEIHGSWSVADFIKLLRHLEDGYKGAAGLEALSSLMPGSGLSRLSADDLLQAVTAFRLAGGLRLGSLRYESPGWLEVIGALNPLRTVKDGITENREINRIRDEARRLDEREREHEAHKHEEAMTRESRKSERQQQSYALEGARLRLESESARFNVMRDLIGRLPGDQQSVAAAQLLQLLMGAIEDIANDVRIGEARMLEQAGSGPQESTGPTG